MREIVNKLLDLQELELIREEARIMHANSYANDLANLENKMIQIRNQLPCDVLRRYELLRQTGIGAVSVRSGVCNSCRLSIPQGDLNRMKRHEMPWSCPNCGRFILLEEAEKQPLARAALT